MPRPKTAAEPPPASPTSSVDVRAGPKLAAVGSAPPRSGSPGRGGCASGDGSVYRLVTVYNTDDLDSLLAGTNGALVVVTTASNDQRAGCLIGFHSQCSIEPVRFALWLSKANHTYRVSLFATHMAVHFVGQQDRELARLFGGTSGDRVDKFSLCEWTAGPGGVPLLTGCPDVMVLERLTSWDDGSDHVCFIGHRSRPSGSARSTRCGLRTPCAISTPATTPRNAPSRISPPPPIADKSGAGTM
jgi:flavin reductase (DIM6/NTAB) family NADH-FMN oxidoreductase RutF